MTLIQVDCKVLKQCTQLDLQPKDDDAVWQVPLCDLPPQPRRTGRPRLLTPQLGDRTENET